MYTFYCKILNYFTKKNSASHHQKINTLSHYLITTMKFY